MGVRTTAWGPHAWPFLEGLCKTIDLFLGGRPPSEGLKILIINVLMCLLFGSPCIYCRRSVRVFISTGKTNLKYLFTKQGCLTCSEWMYYMHENVNRKLFWQTVKTDVTQVWKWEAYQPALKDVKYVYPYDSKWWFHMFTFAYYVMCDFPKVDDADYQEREFCITNFFGDLGKLLVEIGVRNGRKLLNARQETKADFSTLESRIEYVQQVQKRMYVGGVVVPLPREILTVCKLAIVGCDPDDKTKVGC